MLLFEWQMKVSFPSWEIDICVQNKNFWEKEIPYSTLSKDLSEVWREHFLESEQGRGGEMNRLL